ncbi:hypothetical protein EC957_011143 [Mortierella hygrophila]|uniref:Uncharacterized protein n=1 Tax=Mortierella hygrophila TaxID=979708 RepID=A0A9P6K437_9FUNG|nr:hypothetical protein EC957_011143 [Mortierella hygrophila]
MARALRTLGLSYVKAIGVNQPSSVISRPNTPMNLAQSPPELMQLLWKVSGKNRYGDFVKLAHDFRNSCPLFRTLKMYCNFRQTASLATAPPIRESSTAGLIKLSLVHLLVHYRRLEKFKIMDVPTNYQTILDVWGSKGWKCLELETFELDFYRR